MEMTSNNYEVVFRSKDENALIRVVRGKFANFVYEYGQVSIDDESEEEVNMVIKEWKLLLLHLR